jgi:hypothetical protein
MSKSRKPKNVFLPAGRSVLNVKIKGLDGKWSNVPTPYKAGQEGSCRRFS